jgi:hypothetical protein
VTSKQVRCVCQHALSGISATVFKAGIPIKLLSIISLPRNSRSESARSLDVDDRLTMHFDLWLYSSKALTWQPLRRTTKQALVSEEGPAIGPQDPSLRGDPLISSVMTANALSLVASWPKLLAGDSDQSPASLDWITRCWVAVLVS